MRTLLAAEGVSLLQSVVTLLLASGCFGLIKLLDWGLKAYSLRADVLFRDQKARDDAGEQRRKDLVEELSESKLRLEKQLDECEGRYREELQARTRAEASALVWRQSAEEANLGLPDMGVARAMHLGGIVADETGRIIEATFAVQVILHWDRGDLIGKNAVKLVPPKHRAWFQAQMESAAKTGVMPNYPNWTDAFAMSKEGRLVPISIHGGGWMIPGGGCRFWAKMTERAPDGGDGLTPVVVQGSPIIVQVPEKPADGKDQQQ